MAIIAATADLVLSLQRIFPIEPILFSDYYLPTYDGRARF